MAESLYPTKTRLGVLADVAAGKVVDDPVDLAPYLDCGDGERARVSEVVWSMYRAGWVEQPNTGTDLELRTWQVTDAGQALLEEQDAG